jgi:hypothetical protein
MIYFIQGKDYRSQLQLGNGALFGASYIQVTTISVSRMIYEFVIVVIVSE